MAKRRSYFQKVLSQTWKETDWVPVIIEDISAGIAIAVLAAVLKICQWDEFRELAFLIVGTALCGFVFGFTFRFISVTPARLHRELERKVKTLESKLHERGDEIPLEIDPSRDKPAYKNTAVMTILVCLCAGLVLLLEVQHFQILKLTNPPPKSIAQKPIPDKIIPQPAITNAVPIVSSPTVTNVESLIQFETNSPTAEIGDSETELAKIKAKKLAERAAQDEAARKQTQSDSDNRWTNMLPTFNYCIETFYNILKKEADRRNEGIAKTLNYFNCLPSTLNFDLGETNLAEIRFQNQTNVDFRLTITRGRNYLQRTLRISCSCGYFEIQHHPATFSKQCLMSIHIPDLNEDKYVSLDQAHDLIEEDLRLLKDGQIAYSAQTNHVQ